MLIFVFFFFIYKKKILICDMYRYVDMTYDLYLDMIYDTGPNQHILFFLLLLLFISIMP